MKNFKEAEERLRQIKKLPLTELRKLDDIAKAKMEALNNRKFMIRGEEINDLGIFFGYCLTVFSYDEEHKPIQETIFSLMQMLRYVANEREIK